MPAFEKQQSAILEKRQTIIRKYPDIWNKMVREWKSSGDGCRAWLMYSASYLFRTNTILWAMDPLTLRQRVPESPNVNVSADLADLSFVILTHRHEDHLDLNLIRQLRDHPIQWIVPMDLVPDLKETGIPAGRILIAEAFQEITIQGIRVIPFPGLHLHSEPNGKQHGVPSMGYLIELNGHRWLFPGDTRRYDTPLLSLFDGVDGLFAHLWLGRSQALVESPALLDPFCRFLSSFEAKKVILAHLEEWGRDANDFWDVRHVDMVREHLKQLAPSLEICPVWMGDSVSLAVE